MVTACIVLLYLSYAIPVVCLLIKGRNNIAHGPFWMGPIGLLSNIVLLLWTGFTFVMYSFPVVMPATGSSSMSTSIRSLYAVSSATDGIHSELRFGYLLYRHPHPHHLLVCKRKSHLPPSRRASHRSRGCLWPRGPRRAMKRHYISRDISGVPSSL